MKAMVIERKDGRRLTAVDDLVAEQCVETLQNAVSEFPDQLQAEALKAVLFNQSIQRAISDVWIAQRSRTHSYRFMESSSNVMQM